MRQRNPSIDILKFFAALLITNSHMGLLYPESLVKLFNWWCHRRCPVLLLQWFYFVLRKRWGFL